MKRLEELREDLSMLQGITILQPLFDNPPKLNTVQSRFSDILFSDKSQFSDSFAEDHFFST